MAGGRSSSGPRRQRTAAEDAEFRRIVDDARSKYNLSDIVGRRTTLKKTGRETVGICVFHKEKTPSMRVNDAKGFYHCFGCGANGDIIKFIMETEGLKFMDALRWLGAEDLPVVSEADRARAIAEDEADRRAAIAEAEAVWDQSVDPNGTPAEVYARARGITAPLPPSIRFAVTPQWFNRETGEVGPTLPALIGAVTKGDALIGIQRIFLLDGGARRVPGKKGKRSLGRIIGGALKFDGCLGNPRHPDEVIITEGPEDAMSLAQEMRERRVWAALGTAMMPEIEYGPEVRSITIAGQNDDAGRTAVAKAAVKLVERGFRVRTMWPDERFKDWNDQLRGVTR